MGRRQSEQQLIASHEAQRKQLILPTERTVGLRRADALPLSELRRFRISISQHFPRLLIALIRIVAKAVETSQQACRSTLIA